MSAVTAYLRGGPFDGQLVALPDPIDVYRVVKPTPAYFAMDERLGPTSAMIVTGTYRRVGYDNYEWVGWDDERPHQQFRAAYGPTSPTQPPRDEPGPDAMHYQPNAAADELAAWDRILHPQRGGQ